jgi:RNA polymerase-binding transcription factor DksA
MIDQQLIEENKGKLLAEAKRLKGMLSKEGKDEGEGEFPGEYKPEFPEFGSDEDENAAEVTQYETSLALTQDLEMKLTKVEEALKRIEQGTYGVCTQGDEIEEERLRAVPEAETCIKHLA